MGCFMGCIWATLNRKSGLISVGIVPASVGTTCATLGSNDMRYLGLILYGLLQIGITCATLDWNCMRYFRFELSTSDWNYGLPLIGILGYYG